MSETIQRITKSINNFCNLYRVTVSFSGDDVTLTIPDGREAILGHEQFEKIYYKANALTSVTFKRKENSDDSMSLNELFALAKQYDLDVTVTSDGNLNVFDGGTDRQSAMTVDEFNEYITYLDLKNKFSNKMK